MLNLRVKHSKFKIRLLLVVHKVKKTYNIGPLFSCRYHENKFRQNGIGT